MDLIEKPLLSGSVMGQQIEPDEHEPRTWLRVSMVLFAVAAVSIALGTITASSYQILALAIIGAMVIIFTATMRPDLFGVLLIMTLFVPYTWSPTIAGGIAPIMVLFALPAAIAAITVLVVTGHHKLTIYDYLVMALFVGVLLSSVARGYPIFGSHTLARQVAIQILLPYFAFRAIIAAWPSTLRRLPIALIMTGVGLSLLAFWEELRGGTLFVHSALNNPALAQWAINYPRGGGVRAQATMGHPIALGSFLVIPLVLAFMTRRWLLFTLIALGEAFTLSRGPYIAAIVAVLICGFLTKRAGRLSAIVAALVILALFVGPVRNSVTNSFQAGTVENANANYRSQLLTTSLSSLTLWGTPTAESDELFGHQGQFTLSDVTSEPALMSGRQGIVGLSIWLGFLAAFAYTIREARKRGDLLLLGLAVALVGEWVTLVSVSLITSFQYAFWLTLAMTAAQLSTGPRQPADEHTTNYKRVTKDNITLQADSPFLVDRP